MGTGGRIRLAAKIDQIDIFEIKIDRIYQQGKNRRNTKDDGWLPRDTREGQRSILGLIIPL
jgi:hypothetical protein